MASKHLNNAPNWKYHKYPEHIHNGTKIPIVPTKNYLLNNSVTDELDQQQHIYIDDFYTPNSKPKPIYGSSDSSSANAKESEDKSDFPPAIEKQLTQTNVNRQRAQKVDRANEWNFDYFVKKPTRVHFDDDSDENKSLQQNDNFASGSGEGSSQFDAYNKDNNNNNGNDVLDSETQEFIKRISRKWLSKKSNNTISRARQNVLRKKYQMKIRKYEEATSNRPVKLPTPYPSLQLSRLPTLPTLPENGAKWQRQIVSPFWKTNQIRTRRIIANEKKSAERSRQLLLCTKGTLGGGELCRMLFKET
ncbi:GH13375 [Drosophila grimshawi]|uniref:GH13375 n=2 Tax=Drosophila grimshawi TaxID=7222 RepID=B4JPM0_DROGR|nr:GH13375 [Drosophila grimshawi]